MKKWISLIYIFISSILITQPCFAENLLIAYKQALQSDPIFKTAEAQWQATNQLNSMSLAVLLPTLSSSAGQTRSHINQTNGPENNIFYQTTKQYGLNISQVIFDYRAWAGLKNANAQVKQGRATYDAAAQNLMLRVATAYLSVLQAYDEWLATSAQKHSLEQQLEQTQAQFKVGLIPITGIEQVKASYDATVAQEITNQNTISNKLEELRAITGSFYTHVSGVKADLPLVAPTPASINQWAKISTQQNYTLQAAYFGMVAAKANVSIQRAGHFPTITANGGYTYEDQSEAMASGGTLKPTTNRTTSIGLTVNLPIYQGGLINAETRQAAFQYAAASAQMEQTYRSTLTQARENYLGVISGISKLKADKQSIISNQASLDATKAGYTAGNNTIVDVLEQQSNLYAAQTSYAVDQYNYLLSILNLKLAAGTLSPEDLAEINSWLTRDIDLSTYDFNTHEPATKLTTAPKKTVHHKKLKKISSKKLAHKKESKLG